ncbi:helix-turn-helix transcriptional regulator [Candidatus Woesearchaeota archaeon]|nr:helix-turn-helix transcriptional regulator [Candidatus Woesearchaeota archaeon]
MSNNLTAAMNALKKPKTTPNININTQPPNSTLTTIDDIGLKIKEIRKSKNLSQRKLSSMLSYMSQTTISRIEHGQTSNILAILQVIHVLGKKLIIN